MKRSDVLRMLGQQEEGPEPVPDALGRNPAKGMADVLGGLRGSQIVQALTGLGMNEIRGSLSGTNPFDVKSLTAAGELDLAERISRLQPSMGAVFGSTRELARPEPFAPPAGVNNFREAMEGASRARSEEVERQKESVQLLRDLLSVIESERDARLALEQRVRHSEKDIAAIRSGAPGRPTSIQLVKLEFERRNTAGQLEPTITAESKELASWLERACPEAPQLTAKTIENNLRSAYRKASPRKRISRGKKS